MASPMHMSALKLVFTLPSWNSKYHARLDRRPPAKVRTTIPSFTRFATDTLIEAELPHGWCECLHPDGNFYYYHSETRIVSGTDPRLPKVITTLNNALQLIQAQTTELAMPEGTELYLNIPQALSFGTDVIVEYCLIDYSSKSVFWTHTVDIMTNLTGSGSLVEPYESLRYLRSSLEPEFWAHVEFHPCHQSIYDLKAEKDLIVTLRHGCFDDSTAPGSVFPYSGEECLRFLTVLERFHGDQNRDETHRRVWIARLWACILRSRHINRHGLPFPRLDRLQDVDFYAAQQSRRSVVLTIGELFCLGMSKRTFRELTELWNGRIVYQRHWQPFLERERMEWKCTALGGLYLLLMIAFEGRSRQSSRLVQASGSLACTTILLSALLLRAHSPGGLRTASEISSYISETESSNHGLRPLSIVLNLPKASLIFGVLALIWSSFCNSGLQHANADVLLRTYTASILPLATTIGLYCVYGPPRW